MTAWQRPNRFWVNVYRGGWFGAHWSRDFADSAALAIGVPREACVEVSFVDGQGLAKAPAEPVHADPTVWAIGVAGTSVDRPVALPEGREINNDHEDDGA